MPSKDPEGNNGLGHGFVALVAVAFDFSRSLLRVVAIHDNVGRVIRQLPFKTVLNFLAKCISIGRVVKDQIKGHYMQFQVDIKAVHLDNLRIVGERVFYNLSDSGRFRIRVIGGIDANGHGQMIFLVEHRGNSSYQRMNLSGVQRIGDLNMS